MLKILFAILLFGIISAHAELGEPNTSGSLYGYQPHSDPANQASQDNNKNSEQISVEPEVPSPKANKEPESGKDNSVEKSIANYTLWLTIFTCLLFIATAGLVVTAFRQEGHFKRTERAFVFLSRWDRQPVVGHDNQIRAWRVFPVFNNSGTTPARRAQLTICFENMKTEMPDNFSFETNDTKRMIPVIIGPNGNVRISGVEYDLIDIERFLKGTEFAYIWGWVDYNDVFSGTERHRLEFCYQVAIDPTIPFSNPERVVVMSYKKHNGSDDECLRKAEPYKD